MRIKQTRELFTPKVYVASSEIGFDLKAKVIEYLGTLLRDTMVEDIGPHSKYPVDSVTYACMVAELVLEDERHCGVLISETANDMVIMANRFKGVRAVIPTNDVAAIEAKEVLNANIFCLNFTTDMKLIEKWLTAKYIHNEINMRTNYLMDSLQPMNIA